MFSAFFIRRPKFAMVVSLFIVLAGLLCVRNIPVAEYPEVAPPTIMVFAVYPGASSQVISDTIAAPIEAEVNGTEGLIYYSSTSGNSGFYILTLTFGPETDSDMALVNINNAVKRAEPNLPTEVTMNGVRVLKRTADFLGLISFTSDNPEHTSLFLSNYVSINVKDTIARIPGVGEASIFGEMAYSMRIWLDPIKMEYFNIGHDEVQAAIRRQNVQAATGSIGAEGASDYMQLKVDTKGRLQDPAEFADIVIRSGGEARQIKMSDIARIELGAESYYGRPTVNGQPAVMMAVFKLSDGNALQIIKDTTETINELQKSFPEGMKWVMSYDSTQFVEATMKEIFTTLLMTFGLVVLITYIFLQDWRATIIPSVAIPVSLIGTFLFLRIFGMSMNTLTMFALILVIGSVVDDAICVVECCIRLMHEEKLDSTQAAYRTMEELTGALVATTLVVVAVYTPLMFYGGMVGIIYRQFAITMCIALILSTVVALTLSPALCAMVLRDPKEPRGFFKLFNMGLDFTRNRYLNIAGVLTRRVVLTVFVLGLVLYGNYVLFNKLPSSFLPQEDKGALLCEVVLTPGASMAQTVEVLNEIIDIAQDIDGVKFVQTIPGFSITSGEGESMGLIVLTLDPWEERTKPETTIENIQNEFLARTAKMPDAAVNAFVPPPIDGLGATGGVTFALQATGGQTMQELAQAANFLMSKIMESGKAIYASTSLDANTPIINLDLDRERAEALDVPVSAVFTTLQSQLGSMYVNDFNLFGKTYKVQIQSDADFRENINSIDQLSVASNSGAMIPLDAIATVEWALGVRSVERFNMFPCANIRTQGIPGVSSGELMQLCSDLAGEFEKNDMSSDYRIAWTDMSYQESRNEGQILTMVALAIIFAYLFLVAQYESWTTPVSVMLSVVTATMGGMLALHLSGRSMDIYCQLGLLMLVGLTAKTAILMVEYAKQLRDEGMDLKEASLTAMKVRFRAVMMTALSFVIGVFPMVAATGAGAGSRQSIGITTFWGMLVATVVGMLLIPGLYVLTRGTSETTKRLCGIKLVADIAREKK